MTAAFQRAGFHYRRLEMTRLALIALVVFISAAVATPTGGRAQQTGIAAAIHQGNCDEVGDVVAPLIESRVPQGERRGNTAAMPAANSFTSVPISLDALTVSDHAIVVPFPVGEEIVVCGEIGGSLTEAGALIVGLASGGDVRISGIAYLSPGIDPAQTAISLFLGGEDLDTFLAATFLPPWAVTEEDATRFAEALAARSDSFRLAGPFADQLVQRQGQRIVRGAGVTTENFSATVTFVNPRDETETPWDVGVAFHGTQDTAQIVVVESDGHWYYQNSLTGAIQVNPSLVPFDATPGATNTLDLVVEGATARFGVNGEMVARIDLPAPTAADVVVGTGWFADNAVEGRKIGFSEFAVWGEAGAASVAGTPSAAAEEDDPSRFAAALVARNSTPSIAGPFGGTLGQRHDDQLTAIPAGVAMEDFSATVTFVNPEEEAGTPWDYGFAFHQTLQPYAIQEVSIDANGFWSYSDFPNGVQQSGTAPSFDPAPGAMNTLDLVVEGETALFGVNGEFVARFDLPSPMASDVLIATDFFPENITEGREIIYSTFQVWDALDLSAFPATPTDPVPDDAVRFAAALAARKATSSAAGPFANTLVQQQGAPAAIGSADAPGTFSATVTFVNPTEQTETPWDVGFAFGRTPDSPPHAVYVDSEGFWYFEGTRAGYVPTFDTAPGAANSVDLVVAGDTALFGVNGTFVAGIDVPTPRGSGLWVGTGFYVGHSVVGREIRYRDFKVWS